MDTQQPKLLSVAEILENLKKIDMADIAPAAREPFLEAVAALKDDLLKLAEQLKQEKLKSEIEKTLSA